MSRTSSKQTLDRYVGKQVWDEDKNNLFIYSSETPVIQAGICYALCYYPRYVQHWK